MLNTQKLQPSRDARHEHALLLASWIRAWRYKMDSPNCPFELRIGKDGETAMWIKSRVVKLKLTLNTNIHIAL